MDLLTVQKILRNQYPTLSILTREENNLLYPEGDDNHLDDDGESCLIVDVEDGAFCIEMDGDMPIMHWMPYPEEPSRGLIGISITLSRHI